MKNVTSALEKHLLTEREFHACDLYEMVLTNGHHYYYADMDIDVVYNGQVYKHNALILSREQVELHSTVVVDTMTVTITAGQDDTIEGKPFLKAVHDGVFDRGKLYLRRCFFTDDNATVGVIELFGGHMEVTKAGGLEAQIEVKAETSGLNMEFPIRKYYPQGAFSTDSNGTVTIKDSDEVSVVAPFVPRKEVLL